MNDVASKLNRLIDLETELNAYFSNKYKYLSLLGRNRIHLAGGQISLGEDYFKLEELQAILIELGADFGLKFLSTTAEESSNNFDGGIDVNLGTSKKSDETRAGNSEALLANGLESQLDGAGQPSVQLFADEWLYYP